MSSKHVTAPSQRLCGHVDLCDFSTRKTERLNDAVYAKNTLCSKCRASIRALAEPGKTGFYKMDLPEMKGPGTTKSSGNAVRIKAIRTIGPLMSALSNNESLYGRLALAAYKMLFQIDYAQFWINSRQFQFDSAWLVSEVEHLIRTRPTTTVKVDDRSAYWYWFQLDRAKVREARIALDEVTQQTDFTANGLSKSSLSSEATASPTVI